MGEVGLGFPHLASCWLPVQAAWARGESEIPRKKTCVHPDCPQENSVPEGSRVPPTWTPLTFSEDLGCPRHFLSPQHRGHQHWLYV